MTTRAAVSPRYLLSCALSLTGNSVAGVILPLVLLATTGDALAAGTLALICAVPQMLIGLAGGALIDCLNRRDVSIAADLLSALSVALLPIVDLTFGLSFGWFVALGLLGAVGDIPGMTARDALLPAICDHDRRSLQKFMGLSQSIDSLTVIVGPALAAFLLTVTDGVSALWFTAAMSLAAALVTLTLPRSIGSVEAASAEEAPEGGIVSGMRAALRDGVRVLFRGDALLRSSVLLTFGIVMIMGSFQGIVLPVHFTAAGSPAYSALAHRLRRRTWLIVSLGGMAVGAAVLGSLASLPVMLAGALVVGLSAGPASALLGFFTFDRIPAERRGSALGTQNSLMLAAAPVAVFASSAVTEAGGVSLAAFVLVGCWLAVTLWALATPSLRHLDEEGAPHGSQQGQAGVAATGGNPESAL